MELVYLWVKNYKNIENLGFNFSPRFNCDYSPDTNELVIDENDDYIEDFFGENINVTAIVGKNGSGKSSILEILEDIKIQMLGTPGYALSFIQNDTMYILSDLSDNIDCQGKECIQLEGAKLDFLTHSSDMPYPYFEDKKLRFNNDLRISFEQNIIFEILSKYLGQDIKLTSFMFIPDSFEIRQNDKLLEEYIESIRPDPVPRSNNPENGLQYEDCHDEREGYFTENILEAFFFLDIIQNDLSTYLCSENFLNPKTGDYDSTVLENFYNNKEYGLNKEQYSSSEFNELLEDRFFTSKDITEQKLQILKKYSNFLIFDFEDKKGRRYTDLSHGEKSIFGQFLHIYNKLHQYDDICVILDEPDIPLHPIWQKNYIAELEKSFFSLERSIHFIIMTHSPFLLSDIPKQNIIFLDKDADGKCRVVDGLKEKKQTFGANIHTLLSDSFFMDGGLMGEFAKGKINEIVEFHKEVEKIKDDKTVLDTMRVEYEREEDEKPSMKTKFWNTQSIIGEEYLKQVIKNHLVDIENILLGYSEAKAEEVRRLRAEADRLESLS